MDSLRRGVLSPDSIASLTMHVPLTRRMSAGMVVSEPTRAMDTSAGIRSEKKEMTCLRI